MALLGAMSSEEVNGIRLSQKEFPGPQNNTVLEAVKPAVRKQKAALDGKAAAASDKSKEPSGAALLKEHADKMEADHNAEKDKKVADEAAKNEPEPVKEPKPLKASKVKDIKPDKEPEHHPAVKELKKMKKDAIKKVEKILPIEEHPEEPPK
jgi:hypothetical protein